MFIPTINTGGREVPFSTPLGREAESLMGHPLSFYEGVQRNKQTNKKYPIFTIMALDKDPNCVLQLALPGLGLVILEVLAKNNIHY